MASKQRSLANLAALIDSASGSTIDFNAGLIADTLSGNGAGLSGVTSYTQADHDSDTLAQVNAAYVQARQTTYSNLSEFTNDTNYLDSSTVTGVINSSYVQSNQTTYSTADFPDSSGVNTLFDTRLATKSTDNLSEGSNLYYTTTRGDSDTSAYLTTNSYATQSYVSTQINNLVDGAPGTLDTLNEIAAALNDDDSAYGTLLGLISAKDSDYIKTAITPSYIQANQTTYSNVSEFTNDANYLDSSTVTGVISESYIQGLQTTYSTADFVDSAYVSANYLNLSSLNVPVTKKDNTTADVSLNSSTTIGVINKAGSTISVTLTT